VVEFGAGKRTTKREFSGPVGITMHKDTIFRGRISHARETLHTWNGYVMGDTSSVTSPHPSNGLEVQLETDPNRLGLSAIRQVFDSIPNNAEGLPFKWHDSWHLWLSSFFVEPSLWQFGINSQKQYSGIAGVRVS
jgi:hypothetical protein